MESIPALHSGQAEPQSSIHYETPKLKPDSGRHLRLHGLSGAGHADCARSGGLQLRPKRPCAPRDGEKEAQGDGAGARILHPRQAERRRDRLSCRAACATACQKKSRHQLYDEMTAFASYAFNKSHAAAYAVVCIETAWLKRYHPVPFMAAILNSVYGNPAKIAAYIQYCRSRGIAILPPDVNRSQWKFTVAKAAGRTAGDSLRLGRGQDGRRRARWTRLCRERKHGAYTRHLRLLPPHRHERMQQARRGEPHSSAGAFDGMGAQSSASCWRCLNPPWIANSSLRKNRR